MNKQNKEFQARIGHLLDLYRIARFNFSYGHSYTKFRAIKALKNKTNSKNLIETGTYLGVTTKRCAPLFEKVYTIELDVELSEKARKFLSNKKNVKVLQGDVLEQLPIIFKNQQPSDTLVFLDAHFSGADTACGNLPEPAIEELKILSQYKSKINAILIDDFRLFGEDPGFPEKSKLFEAIEKYLPEYKTVVHLDQIYLIKR